MAAVVLFAPDVTSYPAAHTHKMTVSNVVDQKVSSDERLTRA